MRVVKAPGSLNSFAASCTRRQVDPASARQWASSSGQISRPRCAGRATPRSKAIRRFSPDVSGSASRKRSQNSRPVRGVALEDARAHRVEALRVVGQRHEVERPGEPGVRAARQLHFLAPRETIRVAQTQPVAAGPRVRRDRRVDVHVAEQSTPQRIMLDLPRGLPPRRRRTPPAAECPPAPGCRIRPARGRRSSPTAAREHFVIAMTPPRSITGRTPRVRRPAAPPCRSGRGGGASPAGVPRRRPSRRRRQRTGARPLRTTPARR